MSISNKVKGFFQSVMKPSPAAVSQAFKSLKPRVPLIKFRKGDLGTGTSHSHAVGIANPSSSAGPSSSAKAMSGGGGGSRSPSAPSTPSKPNQAVQLPLIEDWQLPSRFQRRPLDAEEIAYINRGGPEK